jgi:dihydrofolate reductase
LPSEPDRLPLGLIVAYARNRTIGRDGHLPWHYAEDLRHFKRTTLGHALIMGRKTHESIGRALPGRRNLVISRQPEFAVEGCEVFDGFHVAVEAARATDPYPYVIGGAALFELALPLVTRMVITEVQRSYMGDVYFPRFDEAAWDVVSRETAAGGELVISVLERRG